MIIPTDLYAFWIILAMSTDLFGPNLSQLFAGEKSGFRVSFSEKQEFLQCRGQAWFAYQQQRITEAGPGSNDLFWTCFFFPKKDLSRKKPMDWY